MLSVWGLGYKVSPGLGGKMMGLVYGIESLG